MATSETQREQIRNRLLRRVDWRFLLPTPTFNTSVCFADGLIKQAVAHVSKQLVDPQDAGATGTCDLAVAVDPDAATLRAAFAAVRPNGTCYTEWYAPRIGGVRRLRQRLAAAGFTDIRCYWAWPWPRRTAAHFWLPLDAPNALHYFLHNRPQPRTAPLRLVFALRRWLWHWIARLGVVLPICAVARRPPTPTDQPQSIDPPTSMDHVRTHWSAWGLGATPDQLTWVLLTGGPRTISKVVALAFADKAGEPAMAIKFARVPEAIPSLRREAHSLQAVHALRPGGVGGVPRVVFVQEHADQISVGETALTGMPLFTLLRRDTYRDLAFKVTDWLIDLARDVPAVPRTAWWDRLIEPVLAEFHASFGSVVDADAIDMTRAWLQTIEALPVVCEQRDCSPWNVLIAADGSLIVLDWESAELQGLPALDLIYFLTYLAFFQDGAMYSGHFDAAYRALHDPTTLAGSVLEEAFSRYADRLGLDRDTLQPLRAFVWMIHARSEYAHFVADVGGEPPAATLRTSLFVRLWAAEVQHMLATPQKATT